MLPSAQVNSNCVTAPVAFGESLMETPTLGRVYDSEYPEDGSSAMDAWTL